MDNDGFISNTELFTVLKMMVGNNLKDTQLQQIVDKTILFADKDEDGKISFEEFCAVSFPGSFALQLDFFLPQNSPEICIRAPLPRPSGKTSDTTHQQVVGNTDIHKKMVVDV